MMNNNDLPKIKKKSSFKRNFVLPAKSHHNLISESLSVATATSTATLLPQYYHELADSFSFKNKTKSRKNFKVNCFQKTCFTSEIKDKLSENDENYLRNDFCNLQVISHHKNSKHKRPQLDKETFLSKNEIKSELEKSNLKQSNCSSQQLPSNYSSSTLFFFNTNCSKSKNNKFVDKFSSSNVFNKSSSLLNNNKYSLYANNSKLESVISSTSNATLSNEIQPTSNLSIDSNHTFLPSRIAQISRNLCKSKWKQLTKGFDSRERRLSERLNINSKNCIEKLLLHEQCKNPNFNKKLDEKFDYISKKKLNKNDQEEHNITETMKSVDYKDLTLLQMLALKSFGFNSSSAASFNSYQNGCILENNKKINKKSKLINNNFKSNLQINKDQSEKSTMVISESLTNKNLITNNEKIIKNNFKNENFCVDSDLTNKEFKDKKNFFFNETSDTNQIQPIDCSDNLSSIGNLFLEHKCDSNENSNLIKINSSNSNWVQLAGHELSFATPKKPGKIWKRNQNNEYHAYKYLNETNDSIVEFLPKFYSVIKTNEEKFIEIQDLLSLFKNPSLMDIKMGCRTFLENEISNSSARPDLYEKLIKIDEAAATQDEHKNKAITKLRYMTIRENLSSSSTLGFRIEAFKCKCTEIINDFKYLRKVEDVKRALKIFLPLNKDLKIQLLKKLKLLKVRFKKSNFFKNHEVIGSSLLIIYDNNNIGVWMIDFAKTVGLPVGIKINHESNWYLGNHEDGYLTGLNNLISIIKEIS